MQGNYEVKRAWAAGTLESYVCLTICDHLLVSSSCPYLVFFKANYRFMKTFSSRI